MFIKTPINFASGVDYDNDVILTSDVLSARHLAAVVQAFHCAETVMARSPHDRRRQARQARQYWRRMPFQMNNL